MEATAAPGSAPRRGRATIAAYWPLGRCGARGQNSTGVVARVLPTQVRTPGPLGDAYFNSDLRIRALHPRSRTGHRERDLRAWERGPVKRWTRPARCAAPPFQPPPSWPSSQSAFCPCSHLRQGTGFAFHYPRQIRMLCRMDSARPRRRASGTSGDVHNPKATATPSPAPVAPPAAPSPQ
jgi:hypothetical protein